MTERLRQFLWGTRILTMGQDVEAGIIAGQPPPIRRPDNIPLWPIRGWAWSPVSGNGSVWARHLSVSVCLPGHGRVHHSRAHLPHRHCLQPSQKWARGWFPHKPCHVHKHSQSDCKRKYSSFQALFCNIIMSGWLQCGERLVLWVVHFWPRGWMYKDLGGGQTKWDRCHVLRVQWCEDITRPVVVRNTP